MSEAAAPRAVIVNENGRGRYQQTVTIGPHALVADEPLTLGGGDAGPAPYDYLLTALGACTSMTLRMYAEVKKLPLTGVNVTLTHRKIEIEGRGKADLIERRIRLEGGLSDEQRVRLLEIANRCPVARTLGGTVEIASALEE